ncbi:MAG TPA: hypothetical protein VGR20_11365 [Acidimicrobiia bacterium]|nr:hypothetical protein [Acidimicrobiia bacterium]
MKRVAILVLAGTASAVVGLASASALSAHAGLGGGPGGVGLASGAVCDHDGLATELRTGFDPVHGYVVTAVAVNGIDSRCAGHRLSVALTDASGTVSAQGGPMVVPHGGGPVIVPVPPIAVVAAATVHTLLD